VEIAAENNSTTVFPIPMELFGAIAKGPAPGPGMTPEEIRALEAGDAEEGSLPEGSQTHLLAETARSILGLGASKKKEAVEAGDEEGEA
jgi:hypothetical protein